FKNNGDLTFKNVTDNSGLYDATYSNGTAYGDLDNDGDLDLVINNLDQLSSVYENQSNKINPDQKWLSINFNGPKGNRNGLGAKVFTWQGSDMQYQYYSPYRGYLSTVEPFLHFGFKNKSVDSLKVIWPDGKEQLIKNPPTNKLLTLNYKNAQTISNKQTLSNPTLFTECSKDVQLKYKHEEDEFADFKIQPLLPHLLSHEGPGISVGDVNADGLEDFFVGGAAGSTGNIFIQQKDGTFSMHALADSNLADNMGTLFFDADNDGDQDLYVVSGGVCEKKNGDSVYQHMFYLNDGKGNFAQIKNALPRINTSGSVVIAADYDHDNDLDLFVGGRVSPGDYPYAPESFLLRNDSKNGKCLFTDITKQSGISPLNLGMVTSALWTDFDNDGWQDLIVVGEFMPITFIKNEKGKKFSSPFTIEHSHGWWNSLVSGDFDNDGDIDYIAGNLGLNGPYKASAKEPVCIYAKDYDKNGRLDPIMCHYLDGKEYTVHARDDINKQITPMRARFRDYNSYANVTFQQAFRPDEISDAYVVRCETFASAYIENLGNGKFTLHSLPTEAQFAPVYGMVTKDFNDDGNLDVLCVGNSYATEVQTGRYDAQGSFLLIGDGKGNFTVNRRELNVVGDNKAVAELLNANGSSLFLISSNSDSLHTYRLNQPAQKIVSIYPDDSYAIITFRNGVKCRREFYYGSTYLSQSTHRLTITPNIQSVIIYNAAGNKRALNF
ncbi:MAG TPA: FG-GAP-like repeat-containing protein, partial [Chitinophagaceae bacterium]|nr:FG-GAP-like repeat-containing protein [Chitinophagaceae bacterium]